MDSLRFLQDLALVLTTAAIALSVFRRLGLPPVLGYLVAGLFIGPHTPPHILVADPHSLHALRGFRRSERMKLAGAGRRQEHPQARGKELAG